MSNFVVHCLAFISGNFAYAYFSDASGYGKASEHAFFQLAICIFIAIKFHNSLRD